MANTIKLNDEMIRELCIACTRNEAGKHFTEWMIYADELEQLGLIEINRPKHEATGIDYDSQYWSLEVTEEGVATVEASPELHPE